MSLDRVWVRVNESPQFLGRDPDLAELPFSERAPHGMQNHQVSRLFQLLLTAPGQVDQCRVGLCGFVISLCGGQYRTFLPVGICRQGGLLREFSDGPVQHLDRSSLFTQFVVTFRCPQQGGAGEVWQCPMTLGQVRQRCDGFPDVLGPVHDSHGLGHGTAPPETLFAECRDHVEKHPEYVLLLPESSVYRRSGE